MVTTNLPFGEWTEVYASERLTGALPDRLTHHVHILEMNGESYRLKQSRRTSVMPTSDWHRTPVPLPERSHPRGPLTRTLSQAYDTPVAPNSLVLDGSPLLADFSVTLGQQPQARGDLRGVDRFVAGAGQD